MANAISGSVFIAVYFIMIFTEPYCASFSGNDDLFSSIVWTISFFFLVETCVNFITPQHPRKKDVSKNLERLDLNGWALRYLIHNALFDLLSMIPWTQFITIPYSTFPLTFVRLLRYHRLPSMISHNPFIIQGIQRIESIGGVGAILARILPLGIFLVTFLHLQACFLYYNGALNNFSTWNMQFDHWRLFRGGIEAASM
ncbi:hypothetical protein HDU80_003941, partial [Chytriomyces hyalinus]